MTLALCATVNAETIGISQNNPGNIRPKNVKGHCCFKGAIALKRGYLVFDTAAHGIRAIKLNLAIYFKNHKIKTIRGIVTRWTYTQIDDKTLANYCREMSRRTGKGVDEVLDMKDPCTLYRLTKAIVWFENGSDPYSDKVYLKVFPKCE